jgi:hypothetical protein
MRFAQICFANQGQLQGRGSRDRTVAAGIHGSGRRDGARLGGGTDPVLYLVNYDNAYHLKYKMQTRGDIAKDVMTEKYEVVVMKERKFGPSDFQNEVLRLHVAGGRVGAS